MLGLSPVELDDLTFRQFFLKLKGFTVIQDNNTKVSLISARLTAGLVLSSFSEKQLHLVDLVRFPWEEPRNLHKIEPELFNKRIAQMLKDHGRDNSI